jgi:hypothetical protein
MNAVVHVVDLRVGPLLGQRARERDAKDGLLLLRGMRRPARQSEHERENREDP